MIPKKEPFQTDKISRKLSLFIPCINLLSHGKIWRLKDAFTGWHLSDQTSSFNGFSVSQTKSEVIAKHSATLQVSPNEWGFQFNVAFNSNWNVLSISVTSRSVVTLKKCSLIWVLSKKPIWTWYTTRWPSECSIMFNNACWRSFASKCLFICM